jgi:hypothetical protein
MRVAARLGRSIWLPTLIMGVAACSTGTAAGVDGFGLPVDHPINRAELRSHPEAGLAYPGSTVVRTVGSDQTAKPHGEKPDPAYAGSIMTAAVRPVVLYGWYRQWLTARGYHPVVYYRLADQVSGTGWQVAHGREQVQIAVFDPRLLAADQKITVPLPPAV